MIFYTHKTFILLFPLIYFVAASGWGQTSSSFTNQNIPQQLYQDLLSGGNRNGYLAFTRQITFPRPLREQPAADNAFNRQFFLFVWSGDKFLIAKSSTTPLTNISNIESADWLRGFDGEELWYLTLNTPNRITIVGRDDAGLLPPEDAYNRLTIIPKAGLEQSRGKTMIDPTSSQLLSLVGEFRRVVGFGISYLPDTAPRIQGLRLIYSGREKPGEEAYARLSGSPELPEIIEHVDEPKYRVIPNYAENRIIIDRIARNSTNKVNQTVYELLAYKPDPQLDANIFSWRTHRAKAGELRAEMVVDGATRKFNPDAAKREQIGAVVLPAKPLRPPRSKMPVVVLMSLAFIALIWGTFRFRKEQTRNG